VCRGNGGVGLLYLVVFVTGVIGTGGGGIEDSVRRQARFRTLLPGDFYLSVRKAVTGNGAGRPFTIFGRHYIICNIAPPGAAGFFVGRLPVVAKKKKKKNRRARVQQPDQNGLGAAPEGTSFGRGGNRLSGGRDSIIKNERGGVAKRGELWGNASGGPVGGTGQCLRAFADRSKTGRSETPDHLFSKKNGRGAAFGC